MIANDLKRVILKDEWEASRNDDQKFIDSTHSKAGNRANGKAELEREQGLIYLRREEKSRNFFPAPARRASCWTVDGSYETHPL
jgi:hypothetical protein